METLRYLRALARSWWLIAVALVAGAAGGFLWYHQTTPVYESGVRMIVASDLPNADDVSVSALTAQRATSLSQIATTGPAIEAAVRSAGVTGHGLTGVAASANAAFVTVTVKDTDAREAAQIAAAFPQTLPTSLTSLAGVTGGQYKLNTLSEPGVSDSPVSPDPVRDIGLGLAAGLVLGIAIAILRETLNRTLRDTDALREYTGLTVLGTVPRDMAKKPLPAVTDPRSPRAEAYRQVRTTLLNQATTRPLTFAVTSAALGEGKTSVACNLAAIFSRAGHRVAIIDADLRRPRVARFFDVDEELGLSDVLLGQATLEQATVLRDEGRLAIVPAGAIPANPAELLGSQAMADTLATLQANVEFVIVDTPPVLPVTDALVVAPLVDGIVIVVRLGGTTRERVEHALAAIDRVKATIIGVVPNQADQGADRSYGYAYRYSQKPGRRRAGSSGRSGAHRSAADTSATAVPEPIHPSADDAGSGGPLDDVLRRSGVPGD